MNSREAFKANLPIFKVRVRGNVCGDSERHTAKSGTVFNRFTVAYNAAKDVDPIFFRVMLEDDDTSFMKGDYVEFSGDCVEQMNGAYHNRTVFASKASILGKADKSDSKSGKAKGGKAKSKGAEADDDIPF